MGLEMIMFSKKSQTKKGSCQVLSLICVCKLDKTSVGHGSKRALNEE